MVASAYAGSLLLSGMVNKSTLGGGIGMCFFIVVMPLLCSARTTFLSSVLHRISLRTYLKTSSRHSQVSMMNKKITLGNYLVTAYGQDTLQCL